MRRLAPALAFVLSGCASPLWEKTACLPAGRLFVPRVFSPLVPGSIYPDRSQPLEARGLPGAVVVSRGARVKEIARDLGRRGVVVLAANGGRVADALRALRSREECGGATGLFLDAPEVPALRKAVGREEIRALVVADPPPELPAARVPILVLRVGVPSGPAPAGVAEHVYASADGRLPAIALSDGADWLAERLRAAP